MTNTPNKLSSRTKSLRGNSQLRVLFDHTNEHAICMVDSRGRITSWNLSAEHLNGYSAKEVLGKNYSMFYSKEEIKKNTFMRSLALAVRKHRFVSERYQTRKDGSNFWARSFITPVMNARGRASSYVMITQDITERMFQDQKKDEYIGIASHELKNPITTLSLYSELLAERLQLNRDKKNLLMLRDIQGQASRLITLVNDLLIISNIERGKLELRYEMFFPNPFFKKLIKDFQTNSLLHKIILTGHFGKKVSADKGRIAQVFINLLSNAVKYSPATKRIYVHVGRKGKKCEVSIQDFGSGISQKDQRDIFTRFYRTKFAESGNVAGSGLGLYISKEIMVKHRQELKVKSSVGKGSVFSFTLSPS